MTTPLETALPVIPAPRAGRCPLAPPAEFAQWRDEPGLRRVLYRGQPAWAVSRYRDIRAALVDPRLSADTFPASMKPTIEDNATPVVFARVDDPEHHRIRRMMAAVSTFRRCEAMRPLVQELVDQHLDAMIRTGPPADLVRDFALPVPSLVISLLLGVPPEDLGLFQHHTRVGLEVGVTDERRAESFLVMYSYILDLVDRRMRDPGDDLISRLVTGHVLTGELTRETAAMSGVVLMLAGHETSANMISLGTVALLDHPELYRRLGQTGDHSATVNLVEELMRYLSIVHSQVDRVATEDFVLAGQLIRAGDMVVINLPAGNWDSAFAADPERLDGDRSTRGHLGFGYGVHQCIGQNLARVEMQVAFATLARRLPGLKLVLPQQELSFKDADIYGLTELPVTW